MRLVSENLVFTDGARIYPVPEPLRLTPDALELLGDGAASLEPLDVPGSLSKSMFRAPDSAGLEPAQPVLFFIPQFSSKGFVRRLAPDVACERIAAINRLTLEVNDFHWYTAALDLLWPASGNAKRQIEALERLTAVAPCYTLGIDRSAGVAPVVDRILECSTDLPCFKGAHP
jgi:hypothetical protein